MDYSAIRLEAEQSYSDELRQLFAADVLNTLFQEARIASEDNPLLAVLEGHSFKITQKLAPRIYDICQEVQKTLGVEDTIEYFVDSSADLNCAAIARAEEDHPHIVVINSGVLERFDDDELRFVIGHELGHLISQNTELKRIIGFIFPPQTQLPTYIADKIDTWNKLSELSADRFGYIASPKLATCRSVFFKLSSGLDVKRIDFDPEAYQESMDSVLEFFRTAAGAIGTTHPINPVRLKALQFFEESTLLGSVLDHKDPGADETLNERMGELIYILLSKGHSPLTAHRKRFLATAGMLVAGADQQVTEPEVERILATLAVTTYLPRAFLDELLERESVVEVFNEAVEGIQTVNPGERFSMLAYMIEVAIADRSIRKEEVDLLFQVGHKVFGFQRKEVAQMIAEALQKQFIPRFLR